MNDDRPAAAPMFILSHARTGSTLLRQVIDTHPDVCGGPELALGRLCRDLSYTLALTLPEASGVQGAAAVRAAVRSHVDRIMRGYAAGKGKLRWLDQSTSNVEQIDLLPEIFPDAQFICLHRNGLDVVQSLLNHYRLGFPGSLGQRVALSPANIVEVLIDSWTDATQRLLEFEAAEASRCVRLTYEQLVADPSGTIGRVFAFLRLPVEAGLLDGAFSTRQDAAPGDPTRHAIARIVRSRVGKGSQIPRGRISEDRRTRINALHAALGYAPVAREGGPAIDTVLSAASNLSRSLGGERWG